MQNHKDIIVVGGGAAGFFAAINCAQEHKDLNIAILERGSVGLQKVKVSGGGRCNVTHAEFIPSELIENYPRGEKELLGPFHAFMTGDTMAWFEERGVKLKIEEDGRVFPLSDSSQTIIDCFLNEIEKHQVKVFYNQSVQKISKEEGHFKIETAKTMFFAKKVIVATGSNTKIWGLLNSLGHTIIAPVPSLFTFDCKDHRINTIPGVVVENVEVSVVDSKLYSEGPLLVTHSGFSAPSILKLSAFGALELAQKKYQFKIKINFVKASFNKVLDDLKTIRHTLSKKTVFKFPQYNIPRRLWQNLIEASNIKMDRRWADLSKNEMEALANQLTAAIFTITGKSTFKEEFVTAGGVDLKEIDFKTFESKLIPDLYFAGEVINVDAITGGFNFQNAWTSAYLVSKNIMN